MKILSERNLASFEFWSGGRDRAMMLTYEEMEEVESALEDIYPDGMTDTDLNDSCFGSILIGAARVSD